MLWLGVPMFFVISGYCIAATCDVARLRDRSFGWYMRRRMRRIFPPYWVCLGLSAAAAAATLVGGEIGDPSELTAIQWIGNLTLTERWRPRLLGGGQSFVLGTAWSLCYEEQFYLVCGLVLVAVRRNFYRGVAAVTFLATPLTVMNWSGAVNLQGFFFDGYWYQFAAGMLVYHGRNYAGARARRVHLGVLLGSVAGAAALRVALPLSMVNGYSRAAFLDSSVFAFGFASMLLLMERWDGSVASWVPLRPIRACGIMCYSLYLTHLPVISGIRHATARAGLGVDSSVTESAWVGIGTAAATIVWAIVVGAGFYRLVERHFLNTPAIGSTLAPPRWPGASGLKAV
jgi:peptidoglycan/LPS O-acetylase OafA/YrhL